MEEDKAGENSIHENEKITLENLKDSAGNDCKKNLHVQLLITINLYQSKSGPN